MSSSGRMAMVPFQTFWKRLKEELAKLPKQNGFYVGNVQKWSQYRDAFGQDFVFLYTGGNVLKCGTTANTVRSVSAAEFRKVYGVWKAYTSGAISRTHIVHDLGVQNASWIIPILKHYEDLMK
jgi:hypothetical protein